jgi:hypothetical protein
MLDNTWTTSELTLLRELYPASPKKKIMSSLSRTWFAIQKRANNLGIKRPYCDRNWDEGEVEKLRELYPRASKDVIEDAIPNRNWGNIECKASSLGIERPMLNTSLQSAPNITLSHTEIAYIAGIVDGEGAVGITCKTRGHAFPEYSPFISISNKDTELIPWLENKLFAESYKNGDCWNVVVTGLMNVELVLRLLMPHLIVKRKRAEAVLKFCQHRIACGKLRYYSEEELALATEARKVPTRNLDIQVIATRGV